MEASCQVQIVAQEVTVVDDLEYDMFRQNSGETFTLTTFVQPFLQKRLKQSLLVFYLIIHNLLVFEVFFQSHPGARVVRL